MKPRNIKEAKWLAKRYKGITLEEIKKVWGKGDIRFDGSLVNLYTGHSVARRLTKFGTFIGTFSCILCTITCKFCIYEGDFDCESGKNKRSYNDIYDAQTPRKLLNAFKRRANHIEEIVKEYIERKKTNTLQ